MGDHWLQHPWKLGITSLEVWEARGLGQAHSPSLLLCPSPPLCFLGSL